MQIFWVDGEMLTQQLRHSVSLKRSSWQQMLCSGLLETQRFAGSVTTPMFPSLPLAFILGNQAPGRPNTSSFIPQESRNIHTSSNFVEIKLMPGATVLCVIYVLTLPFVIVLPDSGNCPLLSH